MKKQCEAMQERRDDQRSPLRLKCGSFAVFVLLLDRFGFDMFFEQDVNILG